MAGQVWETAETKALINLWGEKKELDGASELSNHFNASGRYGL